jgi:predicted HTH transcriptional regulator
MEYKRDMGSIKEVAKDVCTFANASGGLIVYGVEERESGAPRIVGTNPQDFVEQIDNVVASAPSPPWRVVTRLIGIPNSDKVLLVMSVPESDLKPHMVSA